MANGDPTPREPRPDRIVDLVFAGETPGRARRFIAGLAIVLGGYGAALTVLGRRGPPDVPPIVAADPTFRSIELTQPLEPPPPPPANVPSRLAPPRVQARAAPRGRRAGPAAPARASTLAAVTEAPVDFAGTTFVVGSGATYAGGETTASGTARAPVTGLVAANGPGNGTSQTPESLARSVGLDDAAWSCPWPDEAQTEAVDEKTVVLRVRVGADGHAERVDVVEDPGLGFGSAARACALATRFEPARGVTGQPEAALSPPIRVHFHK